MKKRGHKSFWGQKQIIIAGTVMVVAAAAMTWVYMSSRTSEKEQNIADKENQQQQVADADTEEPAESVTKILTPATKKDNTAKKDTEAETTETETETAEIADVTSDEVTDDVVDAMTTPELHFGVDSGLNWPLQGNVILNYSMDHTVYFATLDQYKYNPAVIIAGAVNDRVSSAAPGQITDISTNEVTGQTVTVDLGDGYTAIYGQLKEIPYNIGDYVESGSTIGYINEPTKYYSVEGCNLYFELQKDGTPVDPVTFFQ